MRVRIRSRIDRVLVTAIVGGAFALPSPAIGLDTGRFFKAFMDTETLAERRDLCQKLDPGGAAPYLMIFCQGLEAIAAGSDSLAARLMQASLQQQPDFALGCIAFGDAYAEQQKWRAALRWYEQAHRIAPDRLDPNYGAGQAWLALGEAEGVPAYEKALAAFREMTRIDPTSADGWSNVGMALATLGRYDEAEASYRKALTISPDDPQIYEALGSVAARRGDEAAAIEAWQKALAIDPADAPAAVELASLHGRQGRLDDAARVLEAGVQAAHVGPDAGRLRRDLGLIYLLQRRDDPAVTLFDEAAVLRPDARTFVALGHGRMLTGKTAEAMAAFAQAAESDSSTSAPFILAWRAELSALSTAPDAAHPEGVAMVRSILARDPESGLATGRDATVALVRLLLPDWQIPETPLTAPPPADAATGYDTPPTPIYRALAAYPETAVGIEGTIYVRVQIDARGEVKDAKVSRGGNPALEWAALDAAKRWRFQPALRNGKPVACEVEIPFRFSSVSR